ncbi:MAG TPA: hypothetical protein PLF35_16370, partial [Prolixibacteraceae bacterium]|nr:hypothetical protein [Prolixibacteraceae bacterium]
MKTSTLIILISVLSFFCMPAKGQLGNVKNLGKKVEQAAKKVNTSEKNTAQSNSNAATSTSIATEPVSVGQVWYVSKATGN